MSCSHFQGRCTFKTLTPSPRHHRGRMLRLENLWNRTRRNGESKGHHCIRNPLRLDENISSDSFASSEQYLLEQTEKTKIYIRKMQPDFTDRLPLDCQKRAVLCRSPAISLVHSNHIMIDAQKKHIREKTEPAQLKAR